MSLGRMKRAVLLVGLLGALAPAVASAQDDDAEDTGSLAAVQHRKYRLAYELQLAIGTLPLDAFYKGVSGEAGFTWHINDRWGWEVVHAGYVYAVDSGLKQELQKDFNVQPTAFEVAQFYANSDLVWKPLYGKASFLNHSVVHGELFGLLGAGIYKLTSGPVFGDPAANVGLGGRIFLSPHISLRFDARENLVFLQFPSNIKNVIAITAGISFDFGGND